MDSVPPGLGVWALARLAGSAATAAAAARPMSARRLITSYNP
jgi:hypothetical protein